MHPYCVRILAIASIVVASVALPACGSDSSADLLASAKSYLAKKNDAAAVLQLKTLLQKSPHSAEARFLLGTALLGTRDVSGALIELQKAAELKYPDDQVQPALARALLANGQPKLVIDRYEHIQLPDPKANAELKASVAAAAAVLGDYQRSAAAAAAALALDPTNVDAQMVRVRLTAGQGQIDEALKQVDALIAQVADNPRVWELKGELLKAGKADSVGATKAFEQSLSLDPRLVSSHVQLLMLAAETNDLAAFKARVAELRKDLPRSFELSFYETQLALLENDLPKARSDVQQLLKVFPTFAPVLQLAGIIEMRTGELASATLHLGQAVQIAPNVPSTRMLLARAYLQTGQSAKALTVLQPLLTVDKPTAAALAAGADAYLQQGDMRNAQRYYTQAVQADPANEKAHVALALTEVANGRSDTGFEQLEALAGSEKGDLADLALISAKSEIGDLDGALKAADHLVAKEPQSARSYVVRGRILLARKDMTGARAAFEKATQIDPTDFAAVDLLANLDRSEGKADDAAKLYEAVLARQPGQPGASVALAQLRAAAGAAPAKVEALLTQSIREYPYAPESRLALVRYRLTLHHAAEALAAAQDGVAAIPDNLDLQTVLGQSQLASGNNQQALSTFQKIAATSASTPEPLLNLADIYFGMSDYATTEQYLRKALAMSPHLILAERGLIKVALARKRPAEALQIATQIQQERPREAVGFLTEGEIQFQLRAWDPAIRAFRAALERDHSSQTAVRLEALYFSAGRPADAQRFAAEWLNQNPRDGDFLFLLASEATSRQDYASAEAKLRQVLALRPDNVATLNDLALVLSKQGKPEALTMAERATQLAAGNPVVMDTMATVLAADKQFAKALEWQRKAVAKAPGTPAYQFNLAKLLLATGDKAGARTELEQLAKLGGRYAGQAEVAAMMKSL